MILTDIPFTCFDIETTGLNPLDHNIIEVGAVKFTINEGIIDTFSSFIAFDGVIPKEVIKIHGITDNMIEDAPSISQVLKDFITFIDNNYLLAHNASFDASFIGFEIGKLGLEYPTNPIYDSLILSRKVFPNVKSHSLTNLIKTFKIESTQSHRALDDALATMKVFFKLIKRINNSGIKDLNYLKRLVTPIFFSQFTLESFNNFTKLLKQLNQAIDESNHLMITYTNRLNEVTKRDILPSSIILKNGYIYLEGFCYLREEERHFRIDRIKKLQVQSGTLID
ncbi:MAG: exonuclease domain-containing protein [Spirochaetota bacterium]|nr:exonuclease domain-containing protein [Spirochaetota bacterium]